MVKEHFVVLEVLFQSDFAKLCFVCESIIHLYKLASSEVCDNRFSKYSNVSSIRPMPHHAYDKEGLITNLE